MRCQDLKEILDSYLGDELLVETNHEVLRHLENCPACRRELTARRDLRNHLRLAAKNAPEVQLNPAFARHLRSDLQAKALRPRFWEKFGAFNNSPVLIGAMCLVLVFFGGWFWLRNFSAPQDYAASNQTDVMPRPAESPIVQAVQIAWRELTEHAVGDHKNCALEFKLAENPITLNEASEKYGKYNKDLDKAVFAPLREAFQKKNSGKIELLEAHSCVFDGRRFAHVVLRYRQKTVSVLVTETDLPPETDQVISSKFDEIMRVASFRTVHHAVFVVSDLTEAENSTMADAIFPAVSRHIEKVGA